MGYIGPKIVRTTQGSGLPRSGLLRGYCSCSKYLTKLKLNVFLYMDYFLCTVIFISNVFTRRIGFKYIPGTELHPFGLSYLFAE